MSKQKNIHAKIMSHTILVLSIPLFVLTLGIFYKHAHHLLEKEAIERSNTILNTTTQLVENYLTTIKTAAQSNEWMIEEYFCPDSLQYISRRIVNLNKNVLSCSISTEPDVFPQHGRYFSVYSVNYGDTIITEQEPEFEYFEKNWYKKPKQADRPCWINPFSDFNAGSINHHDAVGSYCIPIRLNGNKPVGVISVDFSFEKLRQTILATHHPYPNSYYMILGPVGGYLAHPESNLLFKKSIFSANDSTEHPDIIELGRQMTAGKSGTMHAKFNGEECHVCFMPIADTGWSMALVCPEREVLGDYHYLTIMMIAIVIIGLLLIWWLTNIVVRQNLIPIQQLLDATKKISEGDYETEIPLTHRKDIVSQLQNTFHEMQNAIMAERERIDSTTNELKQETAKLEEALPMAEEQAKRRNTFIQSIMQQMRAPLNIIEGLTTVLLENLSSRHNGKKHKLKEENIHNITSTMKRNALHLHRMTLMLYDSSDIRVKDTSIYVRNSRIYCNEAAREYISITKKIYEVDNATFETELSDDVSIQTNSEYLKLTVLELLHNAVKFSDRQHISLHASETESTVRFTVQDTGSGLLGNEKDLIFIPFMKIDNLTEGLGLGLPLCNRHAKGLGGSLTYDSDYTEGCRFILELPK